MIWLQSSQDNKFFLSINCLTNWSDFIKSLQAEQWFLQLDQKLLDFSKQYHIFPSKDDIFKCFNFFNIEDTRVVIFGQDPYFKSELADGLCFSVSNKKCIPPSLRNIFLELKNDLGIIRTNTDLTDWAKQGILLINTVLTVNENHPNSHKNIGWEIFIKKVIEKLNEQEKIIFVLLGKDAQKLTCLINNKKHLIIKTSHPSPLSFQKGFKGSKIFSQINDNLIDKIKW